MGLLKFSDKNGRLICYSSFFNSAFISLVLQWNYFISYYYNNHRIYNFDLNTLLTLESLIDEGINYMVLQQTGYEIYAGWHGFIYSKLFLKIPSVFEVFILTFWSYIYICNFTEPPSDVSRSQNISNWKESVRITESNSLLLAVLKNDTFRIFN